MSNIRQLAGSGKPAVQDAEELADAIKDLIYAHSGRMPVATAIGVLDIVKWEILVEADNG